MIIDFYTETFGPLVENVTNKLYFQAWATDARADVFDFSSGSLKAQLADNTIVTLYDSSISTEHRGKGSFNLYFQAASY